MRTKKTFAVLFLLMLLGSTLAVGFHGAQADSSLHVFKLSQTAPSAIRPPVEWQLPECVDCPKWFDDMTIESLQLDDGDHPHIVYGGKGLYYAWHDGSQWHYETVEYDEDIQFTDASLALDGSGHPHISYCPLGDPSSSLKYAWHDGSDWHIETVENAGVSGFPPSLAIDASNQAHLSYYRQREVRYARRTGTGWEIQVVDEMFEGNSGSMSLALDSSGRPHISYYSNDGAFMIDTTHYRKYARWTGGTWEKQIIEQAESLRQVVAYSSLVLDASDQPHIAYGSFPLKYARWTGTEWTTQTIDDRGVGVRDLEVDAFGFPHIVYISTDTNGVITIIKYAHWSGGQWITQVVSDDEALGRRKISLALDSRDRPHIGYLRGWKSSYDGALLNYTWHDGHTWQTETVDQSEEIYLVSSLALDAAGHVHIGYASNGIGGGLKHAWHDGTNWHFETVNNDALVDASLVLDRRGRPHIGYVEISSFPTANLKYAWDDGHTWHIETVVPATIYDTLSLALDQNDQPHIVYTTRYPPLFNHAWYDGTAWHTETIDDIVLSLFTTLSLVVDEQNHLHFSYGSQVLKYALHDGTDWHIEIVDADKHAMATSLALDSSGYPHVAYTSYDDVSYARYDGAEWHLETVTQTTDSALDDISLALDWQDRPHIIDHDLEYAWHDGTAWHFEVVGEPHGSDPAMALDRRGQPHVSYHEESEKGLKYTRLVLPCPSIDKRATPEDNLRNSDTVTYTLVISSPGMSIELWDPIPANIRYVTHSITSTLAPRAVYSPAVNAILWQGTIPTDTVQTIHFQATPGITGTGTLSLSLPIVNTAWVTDTYSGVSTSDTVIVNGWRTYLLTIMRP